jgi:hypothetical protein
MSNYSIYCEAYGSPLYGNIEFDEDLTEEEVWDRVSDYILMTLEVTKED